MLAYLDNVLEAPDAHELERKIEESSFASGLVHRIRDSMRRPRLAAPKLAGKGMGLDPNSVAEYLDNNLEPERLPDFEKVCLESDVHLAEVAACHQILTLVLDEPARVEPTLRNRMYRLGQVTPQAAASSSGNGASSTAGVSTASETPASPAPEVIPAIARSADSRIPFKSLALTLLLGFAFAMVLFQVIGIERLRSIFGRRSNSETAATAPSSPQPETTTTEVVEPATEPASEPAPAFGPDGESPVSPVEPNQPDEAAASSPESAVMPVADAAVATAADPPADDLGPIDPNLVGSDAVATVTATPEEAASAEAPTPVPPIISAPPSPDAAAGPVASRSATPVGRYVSEEQVLARFDEAQEGYFPLAPDTALLPGDGLLTLPTYRPQLMLFPGVKVTLSGDSRVRIGKTHEEPLGPGLSIDSGRAVIVPVGDPNIVVHLDLAGRIGTLSFANADSIVAVEVRHYLPPGIDPELEPASSVVEFVAVSGQAVWQEQDQTQTVEAGRVLAMIDQQPATLFEAGPLPAWIEGNNLSDIDRLASSELRRYLAFDRPLMLSLLERVDFRKIDVRALACRSLCNLDAFEPALEALGDEAHHSYWDAHVDALRASAVRDITAAGKLHAAARKVGGDAGEQLYRSLYGYSPEQLAAGAGASLIEQLESERIDLRVLAYENLRRITGKTHMFRPEQPPAQERRKVLNWRRTLDTEGISYEVAPSALPPTRIPAATEPAAPVTEGTSG